MVDLRERLAERVRSRSAAISERKRVKKARVKSAKLRRVPAIRSFGVGVVRPAPCKLRGGLVYPKVIFSRSMTRRVAFTSRAWEACGSHLRLVLRAARLAHERPNLDLSVKGFSVKLPGCRVGLVMRYSGDTAVIDLVG